jgi:hypothetical protein
VAGDDLRGLARDPHDVQPGAGAVGEVDEAALVRSTLLVWIATLHAHVPFVTQRSAVRSVVAGM